ncbi:MAG TPA: inositol-3-phosphate synthase, partial [Phycisphaerae bacterium]|nr:inositol-3-phosphate synthase [Phycisphaerae bacterium]
MGKIKVAVVGIGNCASSLIQGINYYKDVFAKGEEIIGLAHPMLGNYAPGDIDIVAAVDIDKRKVGQPLHKAVFALPNNTKVFYDDFKYDNVIVQMG